MKTGYLRKYLAVLGNPEPRDRVFSESVTEKNSDDLSSSVRKPADQNRRKKASLWQNGRYSLL